jgi:hypothetical protein
MMIDEIDSEERGYAKERDKILNDTDEELEMHANECRKACDKERKVLFKLPSGYTEYVTDEEEEKEAKDEYIFNKVIGVVPDVIDKLYEDANKLLSIQAVLNKGKDGNEKLSTSDWVSR